MPLFGKFDARRFRLHAAEGGVGVGGRARRAAGVCRLRLHGQEEEFTVSHTKQLARCVRL